MKIRLGYACLSKTLPITSSTPYPLSKFKTDIDAFEKWKNIVHSNLMHLEEILRYNAKNNIHVFRLSSALIPLVTTENFDFNYTTAFHLEYEKIIKIIKENKMRISFHPDQYTILNSTRKEVLTSTIKSLEYHYNLLDMLSIQEKLILLHIGSSTFGKENSMTRFANQFYALDEKLRKCIAIENDDKLFNVIDTLSLCQKLNTPMVLDYHHHICNGGFSVFPYIEEIFRTWKNQIPKVHFSSPKSKLKKEFRSHHDYIDSDTFIFFIEQIKHLPYDIDIMIEAKAKEEALFRLIRELKYKTNYEFLDETTFIAT
jgi:UV DNA damage endonuclease